jgi:hypothetical protein
MAPDGGDELEALMESVKAAFQDDDQLISLHEQMMSLTASADGGAWFAVWIAGSKGFVATFGALFAKMFTRSRRMQSDGFLESNRRFDSHRR